MIIMVNFCQFSIETEVVGIYAVVTETLYTRAINFCVFTEGLLLGTHNLINLLLHFCGGISKTI